MEPVKIHPPEGFEVCPTSTQTEIRFRPISKSKPKWEDFGKVEVVEFISLPIDERLKSDKHE